MKIIFLDIDGVLNTPATWGKRPLSQGDAIEAELVQRVSDLAEGTDALVVISSTWRMMLDLGTLKVLLNRKGFVETWRIIDITPHLGHRAKDIAAWLSTHRDVTAYVALDDDTAYDGLNSLGKHWVPIDPAVGLQNADCKKAMELLTEVFGPKKAA